MLLANARLHRITMQIADGLLAMLAFLAAYWLREDVLVTLIPVQGRIGQWHRYAMYIPVVAFLAPLVLWRLQFYAPTISQRPAYVLNNALQAAVVVFLALVLAQFLFRDHLSRLVFMFFVPLFTLALILREWLVQRWRAKLGRGGAHLRSLVIVTDRMGKTEWPGYLRLHPEYGFRLVKELSLEELDLDKLVQLMHDEAVALVIFDVRVGAIERVAEGIRVCEEEGIEAWMAADFFQTSIARAQVDSFENKPLLIFRSTPDSSLQLLAKAVMDRVGALGVLLMLSPLMLVMAAVIKYTSPGPVFFRQQRSGHYGRPFTMYKFRSMVSNAEQLKDELDRLNEMSGPVFKVSADPRVTRVGRWMRATSIDELPQLINVLKGEMSLVGPRPLPVYETLAISENAQRRRLSVKPGLTCLWQVSGRNQVTSFEEWVKMDLNYIDQWSLWVDIKILLKTIPVVLRGTGAK